MNNRRKIILILSGFLFLLGMVGLSFGYGVYVAEFHAFPYQTVKDTFRTIRQIKSNNFGSSGILGRLSPERATTPDWKKTKDNKDLMKGLGYVQGVSTENNLEGVVKNKTPATWKGVNLYVSGHRPAAYLIDMSGNELHRWSKDWDQIFPEQPKPKANYWRRVYPLPDGSLIALFSRAGMVKLDSKSNILWKNDIRVHHDLTTKKKGNIYVLSSKKETLKGKTHLPQYENDYITVLNPQGKILREHSILQAIRNSTYSGLTRYINFKREDPLHTNTLKIISEDQAKKINHPAFEAGNFLIATRQSSLVMILDPNENEIVWATAGLTNRQHDPVITEDGQLLIFDNHWKPDRSRIIKYDPTTDQITWQFSGGDLKKFKSGCCGTNQELPNGNILITETASARALEVSPEKEIVWVFHNPHKLESDPNKHGTLFSLSRLRRDFFTGLNLNKN